MTSQETHRNSYYNEESEEGELIISSSLFTPFIMRVSMDKDKRFNQNLVRVLSYVIGSQDLNSVLDRCFFWILEKQENGVFDPNYLKNEMAVWNWVKTSVFLWLRPAFLTGQKI